jgi:hypothetical protein
MKKLEQLAVRIKQNLEQVREGMRQSLDRAKDIGQDLEAAFDELPRGDWSQWLKTNFRLSRQTADLYRRIYRGWDVLQERLEAELKRDPDATIKLTLSGARDLLTDRPEKNDAEHDDEPPAASSSPQAEEAEAEADKDDEPPAVSSALHNFLAQLRDINTHLETEQRIWTKDLADEFLAVLDRIKAKVPTFTAEEAA